MRRCMWWWWGRGVQNFLQGPKVVKFGRNHGCAQLIGLWGGGLHRLSPDGGGPHCWWTRVSHLSLCSQVLLRPLSVRPTPAPAMPRIRSFPRLCSLEGLGQISRCGERGGGGLHLPPLHPHSPGQQRFNRSFGGKRQLWTRAYTGGGGGTPLQTKVTIPRPLLYPLPTATRTPATQCPPGQTKWRGRGRNWTGGKGRTKEGNRTGQTALAENGAERRRRTRKGKTGKNHCGC